MDRASMLAELRSAVVGVAWIDAAWVGGSDAFGRADTWSDIDLQLLVPVERGDDAFALVEEVLERAGGIRATLRIPEPAWHGHRQRFYQVRGLPETTMIDLCVMRAERLAPFLDPDRHGTPIVWVDRAGVMVPTADETLAEPFRARIAALRDRTTLLAHLPQKALDRGNLIEAVDTYQRFLFAPLVEALRARHCPKRQDYGLRYLPEDLPADVVARLEGLALVADRDALGVAIRTTRAWLETELLAVSR